MAIVYQFPEIDAICGRLANYRQNDVSFVTLSPVLPEKNALPGAEQQASIGYRDGDGFAGQYRPGMGRHIVIAFLMVAVGRIAIWRPAPGEGFQIGAYRRIGVFGDAQGTTGVTHEDVGDTDPYPSRADEFLDLIGDFEGATSPRVHLKHPLLAHCFHPRDNRCGDVMIRCAVALQQQSIIGAMLELDIVSDVVCPWCFIGKRRLEKALALMREEISGFSARIRWQPFFLNPDTPPEGEPYFPFLEKKFGGRAEVEAIFERVRVAGAPYGITYAFERIALRANTVMAHRLIHWAQSQGDASALVERLFVAQFQRGEHVGNLPTLVGIAVECGYDGTEVEAYLASSEDEDVVRGLERQARQRGISMVPTFVLNGVEIIVGAEDPAILAAGVRRALAAR